MPTQPAPLQDQSWLLSSRLSPPPGLREALGQSPLTAWTSSESTVRSYGSMCRLSNTCRRVIFRPRFSATVLSGSVWYVCLMKRSRCFWFMQAAAWMCVSTCDTGPAREPSRLPRHREPGPPGLGVACRASAPPGAGPPHPVSLLELGCPALALLPNPPSYSIRRPFLSTVQIWPSSLLTHQCCPTFQNNAQVP